MAAAKRSQTPPCRLFVLMAREAPIAVILRRGPTGWYHVIRWRTDTDQFEHGAWFRGRIYEERCHLSPDGELLLYFALQGSRWGTSYAGSWTAVSRVPWLHALALWPEGDTWGGGGRFRTNRKLVLMRSDAEGQAGRHPDRPGQGLQVVGPPTAAERQTRERPGPEWMGRDQRPATEPRAAASLGQGAVARLEARALDGPMLRLHDSATSGNAYKVRLLLTQLGLAFERIEYDTDQGATRTPAFLTTKNANGRVPVLELEDGRCLPESNAILWYLAEGTRFVPGAATDEDRWLRAQVLQWMFFEQYSHEPNIATVRAWLTHGGLTQEREAALPGKRKQGVAALDVMERHLATRPFFVGERYTIADVALYAYTHVAHEGGFDLSPFGAVRDWLKRVAAEPGHLAITA